MNSREERMLRARALYLSVYESQGAIWEANECKELWCEKADRYLELAGNGVAQRPLRKTVEDFDVLFVAGRLRALSVLRGEYGELEHDAVRKALNEWLATTVTSTLHSPVENKEDSAS